MRNKLLLVFLLVFAADCFSQEREIKILGKDAIIITKDTSIEELMDVFGKYSEKKISDEDKQSVLWNNGSKNETTAFYERGKLKILILRKKDVSYKGINPGLKIEKAVEVLGPHANKTENVTEGLYKDLYFPIENIRIDINRVTGEIYSIFLYL